MPLSKPTKILTPPPFTYDGCIANNNIVQTPTYHTYLYLLVLSPQGLLKEKIMDVKDRFSRNYYHPFARSSKPHITLTHFMQYGVAEEKIVNRFRAIASAQAPFKIELQDFGSFSTHTIYINVTTKVPLMQLMKALKEAHSLLRFSADESPYFSTEPHLTIARKLEPGQHKQAWLEYSNTSFSGRFIADKMTLLKRKVDHMSYEHVADFEFGNNPLTHLQGKLFG